MKQSDLDMCKANQVTIITFKEISMTSPSMSQSLTFQHRQGGPRHPTDLRGEIQFNSGSGDRVHCSLTGEDHVRQVKWTL